MKKFIVICSLLAFFAPTALAAGGDNELPVDTTPTGTIDSYSYETGVTSGEPVSLFGDISGFDIQESNTNPTRRLESIGNGTFDFSQNTSFSGVYPNSDDYKSKCGFELFSKVDNQNTELTTTFSTGISWSEQKCFDEEAFRKAQLEAQKQMNITNAEADTQINKVNAQASVLKQCMSERTRALELNKDPDQSCKVPDFSQMKDLF